MRVRTEDIMALGRHLDDDSSSAATSKPRARMNNERLNAGKATHLLCFVQYRISIVELPVFILIYVDRGDSGFSTMPWFLF